MSYGKVMQMSEYIASLVIAIYFTASPGKTLGNSPCGEASDNAEVVAATSSERKIQIGQMMFTGGHNRRICQYDLVLTE